MMIDMPMLLPTVMLYLINLIGKWGYDHGVVMAKADILSKFMKDVLSCMNGYVEVSWFGVGAGAIEELMNDTALRLCVLSHRYKVVGETVVCFPYGGGECGDDYKKLLVLLEDALDGWLVHSRGLARHLDEYQKQNLAGHLGKIL